MKKYIIVLPALVPVLCFGDVYLYTYDSNLNPVSRAVSVSTLGYDKTSQEYTNQVFSIYFNNFNGYYYGRRGFMGPSWTVTSPTNGPSHTIDFQILVSSRTYASPLWFPRIATLYTTAESLYQSGYRSSGLQVIDETSTTHYVNFNFSLIVSDILSSTNNTYQSIVLSALNNIYSSLSGINTSIQNINIDLGQFQNDYQNVNWDSLNFISFVDSVESLGYIDSASANYYKNNYNSISGDSQIGYARNISSMLNNFMSIANLRITRNRIIVIFIIIGRS